MSTLTPTKSPAASEVVDLVRLDASRQLDADQQAKHGQFFTALATARLMAGMFGPTRKVVRILDAGAGVGSLFAATVSELCQRRQKPKRIEVVAYELDTQLCEYLRGTMLACAAECEQVGIVFKGDVRQEDFLSAVVEQLSPHLFVDDRNEKFDWAILNPPYFKIQATSRYRRLLELIGMPTSNIYTGFLAAAVQLLAKNGELVAITPRSFCNGSYFREFRRFFLARMSLQRLHVFDSRQHAFRDQAVLQENVIFHAVAGPDHQNTIDVTSSQGPDDEQILHRTAHYDQVVNPSDPEAFIRIMPDELEQQIADQWSAFQCSLDDLAINVSTGRVVDFRARDLLRQQPTATSVPLIYPRNLADGWVTWPKEGGKKPAALEPRDDLLVPNECYVLVKRFSAKEEKRRVVAAVYDPKRFQCDAVGFENHLNYFHSRGRGLSPILARGLTAFLNSTLLDRYFRQFSGHTQVNASDLRNMKYPSRETVRRQTVHQFLDAGLVVQNPDDPKRPTNSGKNVYQIDTSVLEVIRTYGSSKWEKNLKTYLASAETLQTRYKQEREMARIPLKIGKGNTITLSPGGQNVLVKHVVEEFAPRFTPAGKPILIGDTDEKFAYFDEKALRGLGVEIEAHGKMPDVIIHYTEKNWLVLIEAVTSHGPVNPKRHAELKRLFKDSTAGLVFVTAFLDRRAMVEYLRDISWETEVWVADSPTHLIHFNGERFLGPY